MLKTSFALMASLAVISCSMPLTNPSGLPINNNGAFASFSVIRGKAEFPLPSLGKRGSRSEFSTKATLSEIGNKAVVSLITTPDDVSPNKTLATGLTDASGNFAINVGFTQTTNKVYILEAVKRLGSAGNDSMAVRTYIRHNGSSWESITTPSININYNTTAVTIIDKYDSSITGDDTIGTIVSGTVNDIGSVTVATINKVADIVTGVLNDDRDPVRFIGYQNSKYYILKENSLNKSYLLSSKECPNCNLSHEDLSSQNFSSGDLSYANLTKTNLSSTNLTNADLKNSNLTNANLTGTTVTNTDFTGATWRNGGICQTGSIGNCILPDYLVNTYTIDNQSNPAVAMDSDGDFVVTWQSKYNDGSNDGIYAQRYSSTGSVVGSEFQVNTYTTSNQRNPSIAMDADGDFVITWQSSGQDGYSYGIYAKRYSSTGSVVGSEFQVNTYTTYSQNNPTVAMDSDGDFVITWESSEQDGSYYGIYAQRYSSTGSVVGSEFQVNTYTTSNQRYPSVAMDSDGDFVITWQSSGQDGSYNGIYAQRYSSTGSVVGSEFQVNTYTTNSQRNPSIAMSSDGDFVITWQSYQDGSYYGISAQRYSSTGSVVGSEFQVNTFTTSDQYLPSVAISTDGDFVIIWESSEQDGSGEGIYAQRYTSNGSVKGSEFKVNTFTTNNQLNSSLSMSSDGDFVVTWSSGQDGSLWGIYAQRYDNAGLTK